MNGGIPPAIAFREVSRLFGGRAVLNKVSFEVARGEAFCLLGRSGMGKSVTLKLTIGLMQPDAGAICVENEDIVGMDEDGLSKVRSRIGFLFQSAALFDSFSLHDNLAVPLKRLRKKMPDEEMEAIVQKSLDDTFSSKLVRRPQNLWTMPCSTRRPLAAETASMPGETIPRGRALRQSPVEKY